MRSFITTCSEIVGAAVFSVGAWMAWPPLGVMCAGVALVVFGFSGAVPVDDEAGDA